MSVADRLDGSKLRAHLFGEQRGRLERAQHDCDFVD
jgi:hypothetical protein